MRKIFFIYLFFPLFLEAKECSKEVFVQEIISYENPTPFHNDAYSEKIEKGKKMWMKITCAVFDKVSVGDHLVDPTQNVSGFNFFNKKKRYLERKKYLILKKK